MSDDTTVLTKEVDSPTTLDLTLLKPSPTRSTSGAAFKRLPDWEYRFERYIDLCRNRPFEWGVHDCTLFVAGGIEAITGQKVIEDDLPFYCCGDSANAVMRSFGCDTVDKLIDFYLPSCDRIGHRQTEKGDVVVDRMTGAAGLVMDHRGLFIAPEQIGLIPLPLTNCRAAWKVG